MGRFLGPLSCSIGLSACSCARTGLFDHSGFVVELKSGVVILPYCSSFSGCWGYLGSFSGSIYIFRAFVLDLCHMPLLFLYLSAFLSHCSHGTRLCSSLCSVYLYGWPARLSVLLWLTQSLGTDGLPRASSFLRWVLASQGQWFTFSPEMCFEDKRGARNRVCCPG